MAKADAEADHEDLEDEIETAATVSATAVSTFEDLRVVEDSISASSVGILGALDLSWCSLGVPSGLRMDVSLDQEEGGPFELEDSIKRPGWSSGVSQSEPPGLGLQLMCYKVSHAVGHLRLLGKLTLVKGLA